MYNGREHDQYHIAVSASPNYLSVGSFFKTNPFYLNFLQSCLRTTQNIVVHCLLQDGLKQL